MAQESSTLQALKEHRPPEFIMSGKEFVVVEKELFETLRAVALALPEIQKRLTSIALTAAADNAVRTMFAGLTS